MTSAVKAFAIVCAVTLCAAVPAAAAAEPSDDVIRTAAGDVALHAIHHAAFTLTFQGTTILVDPAPLLGGTPPTDVTAEFRALAKPQLILITHDHPDHFNVPILEAVSGGATIVAPKKVFDQMPADLQAKTKVMANGETATVAGVPIAAVAMYNTSPDRLKYHPKGDGNGYVLTLGGKRIYIAGDTEETPEMDALKNIDVAFLPMNLPFTMDVAQAAAAVKDFRPKVVYPYHYKGSDVAKFKTLVGSAADVRLLKWY
jgi:L-ascorbate metabolism protein UlaG (beta-lactamase superfamily)